LIPGNENPLVRLNDSGNPQIVRAQAPVHAAQQMKPVNRGLIKRKNANPAEESNRFQQRGVSSFSWSSFLALRIWLYQPVTTSSTVIMVIASSPGS
jgi:hypothetical protein